jgi:hypothetical protein
MIKFLFYLFIFYVVYRYVFGGFKVKVFHYHQNTPPPPTRDHYQEEGKITIKSLAKGSSLYPAEIKSVELLGTGSIKDFERTGDGLQITIPGSKSKLGYALVFKLS